MSIGVESVSRSFPGEGGGKDRGDFGQRMEHLCAKAYYLMEGPGEGEEFRGSGAYGIKGQGWKDRCSQKVEAFEDHAKNFGFYPSY